MGSPTTMSVRLVDGKGNVVASTQFTPPPRPTYSNCADLLQPTVRIANGAVYFADNTGEVRRLSVDGSLTPVATFKLTSTQQAISFAVSPDGSRLIAIVLGTPPLHSPPPQTLGDPIFAPGTWSLDLETAVPGGATDMVLHHDLGSAFPNPTVITGWDDFGPTATLQSNICTQAALPSANYHGLLIHLGTDGSHLERIGGADCQAWDELRDGTVLCGAADGQSFSVRARDGSVLWSRDISYPVNVTLAPDGNAVATADGSVYLRDSKQVASAARTTQTEATLLGWAGPRLVVLLRGDGRLGLARATNPLLFNDLGLTLNTCTCNPYGPLVVGIVASA